MAYFFYGKRELVFGESLVHTSLWKLKGTAFEGEVKLSLVLKQLITNSFTLAAKPTTFKL